MMLFELHQSPFWKPILFFEMTGFPEACLCRVSTFALYDPSPPPRAQWELLSLLLDSANAWSWRVSLQALGSRFPSLRC